MGFDSGHQKRGGKVKGTPNQITAELRAVLSQILVREFERLPETLSIIKSPERRLEIVIKLLPYILPKPQETSLEMLSDTKLVFLLNTLLNYKEREN